MQVCSATRSSHKEKDQGNIKVPPISIKVLQNTSKHIPKTAGILITDLVACWNSEQQNLPTHLVTGIIQLDLQLCMMLGVQYFVEAEVQLCYICGVEVIRH